MLSCKMSPHWNDQVCSIADRQTRKSSTSVSSFVALVSCSINCVTVYWTITACSGVMWAVRRIASCCAVMWGIAGCWVIWVMRGVAGCGILWLMIASSGVLWLLRVIITIATADLFGRRVELRTTAVLGIRSWRLSV